MQERGLQGRNPRFKCSATSEALDLTTPSGRALASMLAVFAEFERDILRDWVKAGIDQARKDGKPHGRPMTAGKLVPEMKKLRKDGISRCIFARIVLTVVMGGDISVPGYVPRPGKT
jgi:DNA invertase Pin-like site-specific DNA recombinase